MVLSPCWFVDIHGTALMPRHFLLLSMIPYMLIFPFFRIHQRAPWDRVPYVAHKNRHSTIYPSPTPGSPLFAPFLILFIRRAQPYFTYL